jgi:hypothetical protein
LDRGERLRAYLAEHDAPMIWGVDDCCGFAAGWIERETGKRVERPAYRSAAEAHALLDQGGGLLAMASAELARLGLAVTAQPALGDVGVIEIKSGPVMAIFAQASVAYLRNDAGGVVGLWPREVKRAWTV